MPTYIYRCDNPRCRRRFEDAHPVVACNQTPPCPYCGSHDTHRVPQATMVNWGGLRPSQGEISPTVRKLADKGNVQRRREKAARRL